jgi:hypothetical protein
MKRIFSIIAVLIFATCAAFAQSVGEKLPDTRGVIFTFDNGHKANVRIADHKLQIVFLDSNDRIEQTPFKRAVVRVDRLHANDDDMNFVMREAPDVPYLTHPRFIQPPLSFRIHVIFYPDSDSDEGKISYPMTFFRWEDSDGGEASSQQ